MESHTARGTVRARTLTAWRTWISRSRYPSVDEPTSTSNISNRLSGAWHPASAARPHRAGARSARGSVALETATATGSSSQATTADVLPNIAEVRRRNNDHWVRSTTMTSAKPAEQLAKLFQSERLSRSDKITTTALPSLLTLTLTLNLDMTLILDTRPHELKIKVKDQAVEKLEWKQTDGRTSPILSPSSLTRSVVI